MQSTTARSPALPGKTDRAVCLPSLPTGFHVLQTGRLSYETGLAFQEKLIKRRLHDADSEYLMLLEHDPVITLGRGSNQAHVRLPPEELSRQGIACHEISRGGDVTWHGPGQLVGYPILHMDQVGRDLHRYLRLLEECLIQTLSAFGLHGERQPGKTGVWVGGRKIASIGIGVRRWISWHGFALNIAPDLRAFEAIVPCGLPDVTMTSLAVECAKTPSRAIVEQEIIRSFAATFNLQHHGYHDLALFTQT